MVQQVLETPPLPLKRPPDDETRRSGDFWLRHIQLLERTLALGSTEQREPSFWCIGRQFPMPRQSPFFVHVQSYATLFLLGFSPSLSFSLRCGSLALGWRHNSNLKPD